MAKIIKLDEHLSNMISAGEVVEKVSSVVKELVENSIDANSDNIEIHLTNSGMKEIVVIDNGDGMDKEDIKLSFLRHATSKIKNQYDLYRINTLGFRGEAIPSIAAVSDMTIKSNPGSEGYFVRSKASKMIEEGTVAINKGTIITVSNLFYNTPARLKYLKSENIELAGVVDIIEKISISHPSIRFKLTNNKKIILQTNGNGDIKNIFGNMYGANIIKKIIHNEVESNGAHINTYIVSPEITRARRDAITLVVNNRCVKNQKIQNTVIDAYDTFLPVGRYPIALICIDIDPLLIDVNVHPSKQEIKFSSIDELIIMISNLIKESLTVKPVIPTINDVKSKPMYVSDTITDDVEIPFVEPISSKSDETYKYKGNSSFFKESVKEYKEPIKEYSEEVLRKLYEQDVEIKVEERLPYLEYIGQFGGTYLLFQNEDGLYLVDQHAAAERIRYEYFYEELGKSNQEKIDLIVPIIFDVTKVEYLFIMDNLDTFNNLGFKIEEASEDSFYIRTIPLWAQKESTEIIEQIIKHIVNNKVIDIRKIRNYLAKSISCKGAIKANKKISLDEVNTLMKNLAKCKNPYTCPHGRPSIIKLTNYEIEKMFKRVM